MDIRAADQQYNPYRVFSRKQWAHLRDETPITLEPGEFHRLPSLHDRLDIKEVEEISLPLSRLLSIYVDAAQRLYYAQRQFLAIRDRKMPYIIGIAGSVAGGKSTTARVLHALVAATQGRSGDDRRLPASERGARTVGFDPEEGFSGELRSVVVAVVPERHQGWPAQGARAGLFAFGLGHRSEQVAGGRPARHPDRRGRQRAADRAAAAGRQGGGGGLRLFRLLGLYRRRRGRAARMVCAALADAARYRVHRSEILFPPLRAALG